MIAKDLVETWAARRRFARFHPALCFVEDRLEWGAGEILGRVTREPSGAIRLNFDGGEAKARARLAAVLARPIPDSLIGVLHKAARDWAEDRRPLAMIRLAQAGLAKFESPALADYRLFLANLALDEERLAPQALVKALGLEAPDEAANKTYNPFEPRRPKGGGPGSGEWTTDGAGTQQPKAGRGAAAGSGTQVAGDYANDNNPGRCVGKALAIDSWGQVTCQYYCSDGTRFRAKNGYMYSNGQLVCPEMLQ